MIRNKNAVPGLLMFSALVVMQISDTPWFVVSLLAVMTALSFWRSYRATVMKAKQLAAVMGMGMALAIAVFAVLPGSAATVVGVLLGCAGAAAAFANSFFNYCLGCDLYNWWVVRRESQKADVSAR